MENLVVSQLENDSPDCMEPECLLLCSEELAACPCGESDENSRHSHMLFTSGSLFYYYIPIYI